MFHVEHRVFLYGVVAASEVPRGTSLDFDRATQPQVGRALSQKCSTWNIGLFCRGQSTAPDVPRGTSHVFVQGDCAGRMFHVEHLGFLNIGGRPKQSGDLSLRCSTWNIGVFCPGEVAASDVPRGTSHVFAPGD